MNRGGEISRCTLPGFERREIDIHYGSNPRGRPLKATSKMTLLRTFSCCYIWASLSTKRLCVVLLVSMTSQRTFKKYGSLPIRPVSKDGASKARPLVCVSALPSWRHPHLLAFLKSGCFECDPNETICGTHQQSALNLQPPNDSRIKTGNTIRFPVVGSVKEWEIRVHLAKSHARCSLSQFGQKF